MAAIRNPTETRKRRNFYTFAAWVKSNQELQTPRSVLSEVTNVFGCFRQDQQPQQSFPSHLLQVFHEDLQVFYLFLVTYLCPLVPRETTSAVAGIIVLGFILFTCVISRKPSNKNQERTTVQTSPPGQAVIQRNGGRFEQRDRDPHRSTLYAQISNLTNRKIFGILVIFAFLGSLPWEFVRLYQIEIAKKMANLQEGVPDECMPKQVSFLQSIRIWLVSLISWQTNPCEKYYKMAMVDPLWEVSPVLVITSTVTRCIIYPMELIFESVGRSFGLFFKEIPFHWQPIMFAAIVIILIITIVMLGGYRLHIPFIFKMEPKTPVIVNKNVLVYSQSPDKNSTPKIKNSKERKKYSVRSLQGKDMTDGKEFDHKLDENVRNKGKNESKRKLSKGDNSKNK
ncbi:uncharacterized protein [Argopecten irradians]|uniref:uncharacterized protein isoform X2 n=1 Tax=Argopecten irradians TaxID=31199 RepID=UPI003710AE18